jgi:hypothetical protein
MTTHDSSSSTINTYLAEQLTVGEPDIAGPLTVFPLFGPEPRQHYVSFSGGRSQGVVVKELESGASVGDLLVENPTSLPVLLYEGEEVLGAQQNRTFDITVLVPPTAKLRLPVSCVEAGRWDHSRQDESFAPAPQVAYPELRRAKSRQVRQHVAVGLEARATQSAVWSEIDAKSRRLGALSVTGALHDVYESSRRKLNELTEAIQLRDGQIGMLAAVGGRVAVLDYVSRAGVFADLYTPLVQGYALDALEADEANPPSVEDARGFVALVLGTEPSERDSIGLGRDLRFAADGVAGSGLVVGEELTQVSAFPEDPGTATSRGAQVRRSSRRRH